MTKPLLRGLIGAMQFAEERRDKMMRGEEKGREMWVAELLAVLTVCLVLAICSSAYAFPRGVAAGYDYTVGLKSNGTVVGVGNNNSGQLNVGSWINIIQVAAGIIIRWA